MATPNLSLTYMTVSQEDKEGLFNTNIDALEGAIAGALVHNMTSDADYTLATGEHLNIMLKVTDSGAVLTADRNIILPTTLKGLHVIWNATATHTLTFKLAAGAGVGVGPGEKKCVYSDGSEVYEVLGQGTDGYPMDFSFFVSGKPGAAATVMYIPMVRSVKFFAGLTGLKAVASVAPADGAVSFSVKKNGTEFGTIDFAQSATTATFTAASDTTLVAGDTLTVTAPGTQDSALEGVGVNLSAVRYLV